MAAADQGGQGVAARPESPGSWRRGRRRGWCRKARARGGPGRRCRAWPGRGCRSPTTRQSRARRTKGRRRPRRPAPPGRRARRRCLGFRRSATAPRSFSRRCPAANPAGRRARGSRAALPARRCRCRAGGGRAAAGRVGWDEGCSSRGGHSLPVGTPGPKARPFRAGTYFCWTQPRVFTPGSRSLRPSRARPRGAIGGILWGPAAPKGAPCKGAKI